LTVNFLGALLWLKESQMKPQCLSHSDTYTHIKIDGLKPLASCFLLTLLWHSLSHVFFIQSLSLQQTETVLQQN